MKEINRPETYRAIAEALPWELRTTLLAIRDAQDDREALEKLYKEMPHSVYFLLIELCYTSEWNEARCSGLYLTKVGKHLAEYCTC